MLRFNREGEHGSESADLRDGGVVVAVQVHAGEEVLFGPVPDWVAAIPDAAAPAEESSLPVRVLSMDTQRRMEGDRTITYSALALEFQTPQGLSAGNLSLPWRADNDELTVHKVLIRRGDEVIDVLGSGQTFTVLRREQNLEMAMLDGVLSPRSLTRSPAACR